MRTLGPSLFVAVYVIFGISLIWKPESHTPLEAQAEDQSNSAPEKMTIRVDSRRAVINVDEIDFDRTEFEFDHPDGQAIVRVTGGRPTHLVGKVPDGILLINPAGVYVGTDSMTEMGEKQTFDSLNPDNVAPFDLFHAFQEAEGLTGEHIDFTPKMTSDVELIQNGNVYALAINKDGGVRASGRRLNGRVILSAPEKPTKEAR